MIEKRKFMPVAVTRFITYRPHYNRGAVFIPLIKQPYAVNPCRGELFVHSKGGEKIITPIQHTGTVCLKVGLIYNVEAVTVAKLCEIGGIWVMTCSYSIDIVLFHKL